MSDTKQKVLSMVQQGKISAPEGEKLLAAMAGSGRFRFKTLIDPFEKISPAAGIAIGLVAAVIGTLAGVYTDVRFDGFLDLHMPGSNVTISSAIADQLVAWPVSALILWLVAAAFSRQGRFIDFLSGAGIARVVILIMGLVMPLVSPDPETLQQMAGGGGVPSPEAVFSASMIAMIAVSLVCVPWFIAMIVFAFRHGSGLRGGKLAIGVVVAIVVAETVSKLALWGLHSAGL